jgi:uncharacterized membrane protein (DUF2068 family)
MPPEKEHGTAAITLIATLKLINGAALLLGALGALKLQGYGTDDVVQWLVDHGHLAPEGRLVDWIWDHLDALMDGRLKIIAGAGLAYGAMQLLESYGLFLRRRWAEWLVVVATSIPLPFELYELARNPSWVKTGLLAINAGIAAYLWYRRAAFLTAAQRRALSRVTLGLVRVEE